VQPYGTPANLVDTIRLSADRQAFLQVQAVPNWQVGSNVGGGSFAVMTMSERDAVPYMPTMRYLGER
jgi:hypothetical protein